MTETTVSPSWELCVTGMGSDAAAVGLIPFVKVRPANWPAFEVYYSFKIISQVDFDDDYIGSCLCHLGLRNWLPNHICRLTLPDSSMEHRSHQRVADHPPGKPRLRKRPDENVRRPDRWCRASANSMFRPVER